MGNLSLGNRNNFGNTKQFTTATFSSTMQSIMAEESTVVDLGTFTSPLEESDVRVIAFSGLSAGATSITTGGQSATEVFSRGDYIYSAAVGTATGVYVNEADAAAQTQTVITVDGINATTRFAAGDIVARLGSGFSGTILKGNIIGTVASVTSTSITLTGPNQRAFTDDQQLTVGTFVGQVRLSGGTFDATNIPIQGTTQVDLSSNHLLCHPIPNDNEGISPAINAEIASRFATDPTQPPSAAVNVASGCAPILIKSGNVVINGKVPGTSLIYKVLLATFDDHGMATTEGTTAGQITAGTKEIDLTPGHPFFIGKTNHIEDLPSSTKIRFIVGKDKHNVTWGTSNNYGTLGSVAYGTLRYPVTLTMSGDHPFEAGEPFTLSTDWYGANTGIGASIADKFYYKVFDADNVCFFTDVSVSSSTALTATTDIFDVINGNGSFGGANKGAPLVGCRVNPTSFPLMYPGNTGVSKIKVSQGYTQQLDPRFNRVQVTCAKDMNVVLPLNNVTATSFNTTESFAGAPEYFVPANTPTIIPYHPHTHSGIRAEVAHPSDTPTATGVLINDASHLLVSENTVNVDTVVATTKLAINDPIYESDGSGWFTFVGTISSLTPTSITLYCLAETQVNNNEELYQGEQVYFNYVTG